MNENFTIGLNGFDKSVELSIYVEGVKRNAQVSGIGRTEGSITG